MSLTKPHPAGLLARPWWPRHHFVNDSALRRRNSAPLWHFGQDDVIGYLENLDSFDSFKEAGKLKPSRHNSLIFSVLEPAHGLPRGRTCFNLVDGSLPPR